MKIYQGMYKDIEALICETAAVRAVFLPDYGAKLTSLIGKANGREFLEQDPGVTYRKPVYAGSYVEAECSAFDDMFPTIDTIISSEYPWEGVELPDHGEVYALKWEYEILDKNGACLKADASGTDLFETAEDEGMTVHMWVYSVRFGYRLDKWIEEKDGALCIRYKVQNLTGFDLNYIYAAHCMVAAEEGVVLEVPYEKGAAATLIFNNSGLLGGYGAKVNWPVQNGIDFSVFPADTVEDAYKYFFDEPAPAGECVCRYPDGSVLRFGFDHIAMPWLAIWTNPGGFKGLHNIALEPCTGAFDRPDRAKEQGKHSVLKAYGQQEWFISFAVEAK